MYAQEDFLREIGCLLPVAAEAQAPAGDLGVVAAEEDVERFSAVCRAVARLTRASDELLVAEVVEVHRESSSAPGG